MELPQIQAARSPNLDLFRDLDRDRARRAAVQHPAASYLAQLRSNNSRDTMVRALRTVAGILTGGTTDDGRPYGDPLAVQWRFVDYSAVLGVQAYLVESGRYSPATVNLHMAALRGVLKQCWRLGQITSDVMMRAVDVASLPTSTGDDDAHMSGRRLEREEITEIARALRLGKTVHDARDGALFAVLFLSAARRAEVASLTLADLDLRAPAVRIVRGKGSKSRTCYMHEDARKPLRRWLDVRGDKAGPLMLPLGRAGRLPDPFRPMTVQSIFGCCRRWAELIDTTKFSPHDLRRSWCTSALEAGADAHIVSRQMGHSSVTTTSRYDRRDARAQQRAVSLVGLH